MMNVKRDTFADKKKQSLKISTNLYLSLYYLNKLQKIHTNLFYSCIYVVYMLYVCGMYVVCMLYYVVCVMRPSFVAIKSVVETKCKREEEEEEEEEEESI